MLKIPSTCTALTMPALKLIHMIKLLNQKQVREYILMGKIPNICLVQCDWFHPLNGIDEEHFFCVMAPTLETYVNVVATMLTATAIPNLHNLT